MPSKKKSAGDKKPTAEKKAVAKKAISKKVMAPKIAKPLALIKRKGYSIYVISPKNEKLRNELMNSGKVVGENTISSVTKGQSVDEVVVIVRS